MSQGHEVNKLKVIIKHGSISERKTAWKENRASYNQWRASDEGKKYVGVLRGKQLNCCFMCLSPLGRFVHVDHIFPLYFGGTNNKPNLCLMHPDCNMRKGVGFMFSYKEACKRRALFNKIRKGLSVKRTIHKKPGHVLTKKQLSSLKFAEKYLGDLDEYLGYAAEEETALKLRDMFRED